MRWSTFSVAKLLTGGRQRTRQPDHQFTWAPFEEEFNTHYYPLAYQMQKRREFETLEQGGMTVTEYETKFSKLAKNYPEMIQNDKAKSQKCYMGLRNGLRDYLVKWQDYGELVQMALQMEMSRNTCPRDGGHDQGGKRARVEYGGPKKHNNNYRANYYQGNPPTGGKPPFRPDANRGPGRQGSNGGRRPPCPECGRDHIGPCRFTSGACLKCENMGHWQKHCPLWKRDRDGGAPRPPQLSRRLRDARSGQAITRKVEKLRVAPSLSPEKRPRTH